MRPQECLPADNHDEKKSTKSFVFPFPVRILSVKFSLMFSHRIYTVTKQNTQSQVQDEYL